MSGEGWGGGEGEKMSETDSTLSVEPDSGLDPTTSKDCVTQVPQELKF